MKKWLILILTSLIIGSIILAFNIRNNYKFVEVDNATRQMYINYLNKQVRSNGYKSTKQEIRTLLEDELDFRDYSNVEGDYKVDGYAGKFSKIIEINKDLDVETYCFDLCHEMCHLKYESSDEIYTNFMAFKTLYESDNEVLNHIGKWFGIYILNGDYEREYDCSQLIVDYLSKSVDNNIKKY